MTDNEIIKAFQMRTLKGEHPGFVLCGQTVDLINRQKAEIERLTNAYKQCAWERDAFLDELKTAKSESIKEFAERLKENVDLCSKYLQEDFPEIVDNLVKEMVGE